MEKSKIIVTGATGSIGLAAVKSLLSKDLPVIMACRNIKKADGQRDSLIKEFPHSEIDIIELDLNTLASIRAFVEEIKNQGFKVDKLLNNAGIICRDFTVNDDGFETTLAVNYLGPLYLSKLMIPLMDNDFNIVNTVSVTRGVSKLDEHFFDLDKKRFSQLGTYGKAKYALFLSSLTLSEKIKNGSVNLTDPGVVDSNMISMHRWFDPLADVLFRPFCKSPEKGAIPAVNALLQPIAKSQQPTARNVKLFSGNRSKVIPQKHYDNPLRKWLWEESGKQLTMNNVQCTMNN
ncbi:MAG: SDR family NAD(P)-dependent oxidoreductase [Bacteroidales bacterium]|nr:SDR family NAD(P)-dependent oxidoreductase [Bacteroidales bacterium]MBR7175699.1 SDR family NAD(P)-dependent oxidoreductase [Bacteroidales bacterium]